MFKAREPDRHQQPALDPLPGQLWGQDLAPRAGAPPRPHATLACRATATRATASSADQAGSAWPTPPTPETDALARKPLPLRRTARAGRCAVSKWPRLSRAMPVGPFPRARDREERRRRDWGISLTGPR